MTNIVLHSKTSADSKLHLEAPVGQPNAEFEVELVIRPTKVCRVLPPGYFGLIGSVDDDTLIVHPQPPLPPPVELKLFTFSIRTSGSRIVI
jgi:hypothetical protein